MAGINVEQHLVYKISTEHLKSKNEKELLNQQEMLRELSRKLRKDKNNNELKIEIKELKNSIKDLKELQENSPWEIEIDINDAFKEDKAVKLFDSQVFRLIKNILLDRYSKGVLNDNEFNPNHIQYYKYLMSLVIDHGDESDFEHVLKNGIKINGVLYKRFVGTTGGLKKNSVIFINEEIVDELNEKTTSRTFYKDMVAAKFEAYKALTCSASQEIAEPNKILVVSDVLTHYIDTIIELDDTVETDNGEPKREIKTVELENNGSDGYNLCTIEYMQECAKVLKLDYIPSGLCLRNKWTKGMMYPFPIKEFVREFANVTIDEYGNEVYMVKDIWNHDINIMDVDLILTESSLKLANSYSSIDDYINNYKKSGYRFATTKIISPEIDDERCLNYQYLQSFDFSNEDIKDLCKPTIDFLKGSMGETYEDVINFLGIKEDLNDYTWQHALNVSPYMLKDPYIIESIHRLIKKKIDEAKMGKLICNGNFQTFCTDPVCLMQNILGLEVKGLLKANECYSSYWIKKEEKTDIKIDEILAFRSPMTCHNNIRKLSIIKNSDVKKWYKYMTNVFIVNCFDSFMKAENGEDSDGDANFTTNNNVLLRCYKNLPAVSCIQKAASKTEITDETLEKSNMLAFGNDVGTITNYVTSMLEVQSRFEKDSDEYKELEYRIQCGQLYQQNCLDSIKGIVSKPMPKYWFKRNQCVKLDGDGNVLHNEKNEIIYDDYLLSICAEKKPYFMIYRYPEVKKDYTTYQDKNNIKAMQLFGCTLEELLNKDTLNESEQKFVKWYYEKLPVGISNCAMNNICRYVEKEMSNYKSKLKKDNSFDYTKLKIKINMTKKNKEAYTLYYPILFDLCNTYVSKIAEFKTNSSKAINDKETAVNNRNELRRWIKKESERICPDDKLRLNIILDLCYGQKNNKQFCWDTVGKLIVEHLKEVKIDE